jgi:uncharacterized RDD family membrane protein YckC/Tfp pilus assembly major pilin PilA
MQCANCGSEIRNAEQTVCAKCGRPVSRPYAVSPSALQQREWASSGTPPYAGFWRRALAYLIDSVLMVVIYLCMVAMLRIIGPGKQAFGLISLLYMVIAWLYNAGLESSATQATLGKSALGIKVTDLNGSRIGFGRATGRYFAHIITGLTLGVGYATVVFTRKRQSVHDMIAETLVVQRDFSPEQIAAAGPAPRVPVLVSVFSVVAMIVIGPFGMGVLAAISVPAYQNYTIRAQITEGLMAAAPYQTAVTEAYNQGLPFRSINSRNLSVTANNSLKYVDSLQVVSGAVVIRYGRSANRNIAQKAILLVPAVDGEKNIVWICGHHSPAIALEMAVPNTSKFTTVGDQYLPNACRQGT